ncbi:hypothetical protein CKO50_17295 [Pseudoalteromonas sp. HM-SA03]|uniref:hypothetical protein n=1 Tax=Pseudoalteromonas sp. HM-SA03 TaxID=2029678 RepID=UPI000BAE4C80|nr:hypothetical protein [Pseudoalteromonas sp. HM-SA03]PAY00033.1 hypothetical protein CKO50_17295 [Pseudoalteromonas sp. HM-SA03]
MAKNYWIKAAENRTKSQLVEISPLNLSVPMIKDEYRGAIDALAIKQNQHAVSVDLVALAEAKPRIKVNSGDVMNYELSTGYIEGYRAARDYIDSCRALAENLRTFNSKKDTLKVI